jgi:FkbM family methyltransferase
MTSVHLPQAFYSQHGEDYLLFTLFRRHTDGFYVDVGAFDGVHISNSYLFERLGWRGICVEAHPEYFSWLERNRPGATCVQAACVGPGQPSKVRFQAEKLGLLSGLQADETSKIERRYAARGLTFQGFETIDVPALTLNQIMDRHTGERRIIEIVSVDTEGNELDILRGFDFSKWTVTAFVIEANSDEAGRELISFMRSRGYKLARRLGCNLIFVRRRDDMTFLRYRRIDCTIADTLHPMGEQATLKKFRGRDLRDYDAWLTDNVLCQAVDQPLSALLDYAPQPYDAARAGSVKLVHAVNLFPEQPGLESVQDAVVTSMREAAADGGVTLVNVQAATDPDLTPPSFVHAAQLTRSVADVKTFDRSRPLPLLFDILDRAAEYAGPDDYIIYTNADICLRPYFYHCIRDLIALGFDAITVNRRTIGDRACYPVGSSLARAETGLDHRGFDCFVFPKAAYTSYARSQTCIGMGGGMARSLLYNMVARAEHMVMLKNVALTYHFGNDRTWASAIYHDYTEFNRRQFLAVLDCLAEKEPARRRLHAFCTAHREPQVARDRTSIATAASLLKKHDEPWRSKWS